MNIFSFLKMSGVACGLVFSVMGSANAEGINLAISKMKNPSWPQYNLYVIDILSKNDSITIKNVVFNRGKCNTTSGKFAPLKLGFGEKGRIYPACNPIEMELQTDKGTLVSTWDR